MSLQGLTLLWLIMISPRVLLVEDEPLLAVIFETGLQDAGFDVLLARDAGEAIAILDDVSPTLSAVITDIRLGNGPKGWTVATHARELISTIPIVYMTGDSAADWSAHGVPDSVLIQKPFVAMQLVTAVSMLMNAASTQLGGEEERPGVADLRANLEEQ